MATNLVHDVFERVRAVNGKTDKDEVRLGVRQRPQSVVLLLSGRIPKRQLNDLAGGRVYGIGDVVLEHCRDIFLSQQASETRARTRWRPLYLRGVRMGSPRGSILGCS